MYNRYRIYAHNTHKEKKTKQKEKKKIQFQKRIRGKRNRIISS